MIHVPAACGTPEQLRHAAERRGWRLDEINAVIMPPFDRHDGFTGWRAVLSHTEGKKIDTTVFGGKDELVSVLMQAGVKNIVAVE